MKRSEERDRERRITDEETRRRETRSEAEGELYRKGKRQTDRQTVIRMSRDAVNLC